MKNERRLIPLKLYTVTYGMSINQQDMIEKDTFTADVYAVDEGRFSRFYNAGNLVREYQIPLISVVVAPVDEA